ncbi:hypothetical protein GCM10023318_58140 [Nocardia callitridis]|uniref:Uncharacterized protein n=1 Tax=Nocardia callitridis TaxID=648753 RepID=A0ABP9KYR4_9NOCA
MKIGIAAVLLIVVIGGIFGLRTVFRSDGQKIEAGQCAKLAGSTYKPEFAIKECTDPEANYVVAERLDSGSADCATEDYASYYQTGKSGYTVCLRLNVAEGDCVDAGTMAASTKIACTASGADYKIGKIVQGSATPSACGADYTADEVIAYPKPDPMTLCLVAVDS